MKSYLSLVKQYANVHKKKNRLTVICVAISVMLVTAVFGMADMSLQAQMEEHIRQKGNFHASLSGISDAAAREIGGRGDVKVSGWVCVAEDTSFRGKDVWVQGGDRDMAEQMGLVVTEGRYPLSIDEAVVDKSALEELDLSIEDTAEITMSDGQTRQFTITGVYDGFSSLKRYDAHGLFLSTEGMRSLGMPSEQYREYYYVQFRSDVNIGKALADIAADYALSDEQISANDMLLGLMGQSDSDQMTQIYMTAGVLSVLVAMAGIFMIASSFNMSILERTQFFGLLRCVGATKKQIRRYIRLEGLRFCLTGVPLGLLAGCGVMWVALLCLNILNSPFLPEMPLLRISRPAIVAGAVLGVLVVMLASGSPARKASHISPQAAVTGNIAHAGNVRVGRASDTRRFRVDTAMGFRHAFSYKKSLLFVAGSFGLSIILFLSFSVFITFMGHALNPLKPYAPDISVANADMTAVLDRSLLEELKTLPHMETIYARMAYEDISASDGQDEGTAVLISYDAPQFDWAEDMLILGGTGEVQNENGILVEYAYADEYGWEVGDRISLTIAGQRFELPIAGILSDSPFNSNEGEWIVICSEATFTELTGISAYTVIDMQVSEDISPQVRSLLTPEVSLYDRQQGNAEAMTAYYAMAVFVYGFLAVIAVVALINIINTVNASVAGRMGHYGIMRAVGMSCGQLKKMITAEASAYAVTGCLGGGVLGILLHRMFFRALITSNWGDTWQPPFALLAVIIAAAFLITHIAVQAPTRQIREMSIVKVVNAG